MPFTFNLTADAPKRPTADAEQSIAKKPRASTPSAASLVVMDSMKKTDRPQRLPTTADLVLCIYKVTNRAGDLWDNFQGTDCGLWQIQAVPHANACVRCIETRARHEQVDHPAKPSIIFNLRDGFNDFLTHYSTENEGAIP